MFKYQLKIFTRNKFFIIFVIAMFPLIYININEFNDNLQQTTVSVIDNCQCTLSEMLIQELESATINVKEITTEDEPSTFKLIIPENYQTDPEQKITLISPDNEEDISNEVNQKLNLISTVAKMSDTQDYETTLNDLKQENLFEYEKIPVALPNSKVIFAFKAMLTLLIYAIFFSVIDVYATSDKKLSNFSIVSNRLKISSPKYRKFIGTSLISAVLIALLTFFIPFTYVSITNFSPLQICLILISYIILCLVLFTLQALIIEFFKKSDVVTPIGSIIAFLLPAIGGAFVALPIDNTFLDSINLFNPANNFLNVLSSLFRSSIDFETYFQNTFSLLLMFCSLLLILIYKKSHLMIKQTKVK